jgi:hypothetical protein
MVMTEYVNGMNRNVKYEGNKGTLIKYKGIHQCAIRLALNLPVTSPLPFLKSDKDGVPRVLKPLVPFLKGDEKERRLALTVTNLYRIYHTKVDKDTTSITQEGQRISPEFLEGFRE